MLKRTRQWYPEMATSHIISRHGSEPLNSSRYSAVYPDVHAAGCRLFGTWKAAIEACGIDYDEVRRYRRWSDSKVLSETRRLKREGGPLNSIHIQNNHRPLYHAGIKRFGSWNAVLKAVGVDHRRVMLRRRLEKVEIREAVAALDGKGADFAYASMRRDNSRLLAAASRKLGGGSWTRARRRCGV